MRDEASRTSSSHCSRLGGFVPIRKYNSDFAQRKCWRLGVERSEQASRVGPHTNGRSSRSPALLGNCRGSRLPGEVESRNSDARESCWQTATQCGPHDYRTPTVPVAVPLGKVSSRDASNRLASRSCVCTVSVPSLASSTVSAPESSRRSSTCGKPHTPSPSETANHAYSTTRGPEPAKNGGY